MNQQPEILIDKSFIKLRVEYLGKVLSDKFADKNPVFLVVLKGAFLFAADLIRSCNMDLEISFLQVSSYQGTESTGKVSTKIPLSSSLKNRHVIIVEDIIETGKTLLYLYQHLQNEDCASIQVVTALHKINPKVELPPIELLSAFVIPPAFVIGYGLDYNQHQRNLPSIHIHKSNL
ncbi:MAG: phosphoribosyltransferase [Saprospiraceae bacterium]|jgi:hypoxanthine phosphoribosyltransferase